ncbi:MAG: RecX family transcriptional regulator [Acidobacteriota bacterium]
MGGPRHPRAAPEDPMEAARVAYVAGLRWLAGRELSTARVRERLRERGYPDAIVTDTLRRLTGAGALDDRRAAHACARTLLLLKRRGRLRVLRELERMGFDAETARAAVSSVLEDQDERHLADCAAAARLRGVRPPLGPAVRRRVFAALLRQGFAPSLIHEVLRGREADCDEPTDP